MIMQLSNQNCHYVNIILSNTPRPHHGWPQCPQLMFWCCHHQNTVIGRVHGHCATVQIRTVKLMKCCTCLQWSTSLEYQPGHSIPPQLSSGKLNANFGSFIYLARVQFFHIYLQFIDTYKIFFQEAEKLRGRPLGPVDKYRQVQYSTVQYSTVQ